MYFSPKTLEKTIDLSAGADLVIYGTSKNPHSGFASPTTWGG